MRISQKFGFFGVCLYQFFSCPSSQSFFSAILLSLLFSFHILSGCRKTLGVNYGQSLQMGPWRSITCIMGHFTPENVVFQLAMSECRRYPKPTFVYPCSTKSLSRFKLITSLRRSRIWLLGHERVNCVIHALDDCAMLITLAIPRVKRTKTTTFPRG